MHNDEGLKPDLQLSPMEIDALINFLSIFVIIRMITAVKYQSSELF